MVSRCFGLIAVSLAVVVGAPAPSVAQDSMSPELVVSSQDFDEAIPSVAYNSQHREYLVVWHTDSPLQGRWVEGKRYTESGIPIAEFTIAFEDSPPRDNAQPTVAYDPVNDRYLVAWVHDVYGDASDWDVVGRLVPWDGPDPSLQGFDICTFSSKQWNPKVAYADTQQEFLVVWWNQGSGGVASYISAQRVSPAGAKLGSTITVAFGTEERVAPDVAYNQSRNEYLIVYQMMDSGGGDIEAVRMNAGGSILGGGEFGIAAWPGAETEPAVAASPAANEWAVVWQAEGSSMRDIYARRLWIDAAGATQFAAPVLVDSTSFDEILPDITSRTGASGYDLVWQGQYGSGSGPFGVFSRSLDTSNTLSSIAVIRGIFIGETITCRNPTIAGGNVSSFVAWEHTRDAVPAYRDIHGRVMADPIFRNGFESGTTGAWSLVVP